MQRKLHDYAVVPLTVAGLSALCGCGRSFTPAPAASPPPPANVSVVHPRRGEVTRSISLPGTVLAYQAATLYGKIPGYLKTIAVDKGDAVKAGDCLAEIEDPELLAELPKYQAEVAVAEADFQRVSEAQKQAPDLVMPLTVDEARGKYRVARANLKRIHDLLAYAKVTAPFAGVVTHRWVDPGAFIPAATASSAANTAAVVTLMDFSRVRVDVAVPETETPFVTTTVPVAVTVEELPGRAFHGNVTRFEYALDPATRTMITEIEIPNPDRALRPGMYALVRLGLERKPDALLLPADALVSEKGGASIFTVADGKAKKVPVKTGFNDGVNAEITGGLSGAEAVMLVGQQAVADGQPVNVVEAK